MVFLLLEPVRGIFLFLFDGREKFGTRRGVTIVIRTELVRIISNMLNVDAAFSRDESLLFLPTHPFEQNHLIGFISLHHGAKPGFTSSHSLLVVWQEAHAEHRLVVVSRGGSTTIIMSSSSITVDAPHLPREQSVRIVIDELLLEKLLHVFVG